MSLNSESKLQKNSALETLVEQSRSTLETVSLTPYRPEVYALPSEWLDEMRELLVSQVQFLPTLYKQMDSLVTAEQAEQAVNWLGGRIAESQREEARLIREEHQKTSQALEEAVSQAGKKLAETILTGFSAELDKLKRALTRLIIWASAGTAALSGLVFLACWKLGH